MQSVFTLGVGGGILLVGLGLIATDAVAFKSQWKQSSKTLHQLVREGYEIKSVWENESNVRFQQDLSKAYRTSVVHTVVQKQSSVFHCRETAVKEGEKAGTTFIYCFELVEVYEQK